MTFLRLSSSRGFTRVDLLALVSVVGILALMSVPLVAGTHHNSRAAVCLTNLKDLLRSWTMYADDHDDDLVSNLAWAGGSWLQGSSSDPNNWDHATYTQSGLLWPYVGRTDAFVCPEDPSRVVPLSGPDAGRSVPRIRSYSMNGWVGGAGWGPAQGWTAYTHISQLADVEPTMLWVLLCERADSINDGFFGVDVSGFPEDPSRTRIVDYPSYYHSRGAGIGFVDGHATVQVWRDARTTPEPAESLLLDIASPHNPDVIWLQERSTRRASTSP